MGTEKRLISVIIPTLNCEDRVARSIESVLAQDYGFKDIRLTIVDNWSEDETYERCLGYARHNLGVYRLREKLLPGLMNPTSLRFPCTKGLTVLLEPGDVLAPEFVTRCATLFNRHPELGTVVCEADLYHGDEVVPQEPAAGKSYRTTGRKFFERMRTPHFFQSMFRLGQYNKEQKYYQSLFFTWMKDWRGYFQQNFLEDKVDRRIAYVRDSLATVIPYRDTLDRISEYYATYILNARVALGTYGKSNESPHFLSHLSENALDLGIAAVAAGRREEAEDALSLAEIILPEGTERPQFLRLKRAVETNAM